MMNLRKMLSSMTAIAMMMAGMCSCNKMLEQESPNVGVGGMPISFSMNSVELVTRATPSDLTSMTLYGKYLVDGQVGNYSSVTGLWDVTSTLNIDGSNVVATPTVYSPEQGKLLSVASTLTPTYINSGEQWIKYAFSSYTGKKQEYAAVGKLTEPSDVTIAYKVIPLLNEYALKSVTATCANPSLSVEVSATPTFKMANPKFVQMGFWDASPMWNKTSSISTKVYDGTKLSYYLTGTSGMDVNFRYDQSSYSAVAFPNNASTKDITSEVGSKIYGVGINALTVKFDVTVKEGSTVKSTTTYTKTFDLKAAEYQKFGSHYDFSVNLNVDEGVGSDQGFSIDCGSLVVVSKNLGTVNASDLK